MFETQPANYKRGERGLDNVERYDSIYTQFRGSDLDELDLSRRLLVLSMVVRGQIPSHETDNVDLPTL